MRIKWAGTEKLSEVLIKKAKIDFNELAKDSAKSIYTRAQQSGGTPVGKYVGGGQLRGSARYNKNEVGYIKDYAAHVEYGHSTRSGGFVKGQYYLKKNVAKEKKLYIKRLNIEIKKGG